MRYVYLANILVVVSNQIEAAESFKIISYDLFLQTKRTNNEGEII